MARRFSPFPTAIAIMAGRGTSALFQDLADFFIFIFKCCFTSTETVRTIRDGEPRTSTSTHTLVHLLELFDLTDSVATMHVHINHLPVPSLLPLPSTPPPPPPRHTHTHTHTFSPSYCVLLFEDIQHYLQGIKGSVKNEMELI